MILMRVFAGIMVILLLGACKGKTIKLKVLNQSPYDRISEMVSVDWQEIVRFLDMAEGRSIIISDSKARQVDYQLIYEGGDTPKYVIFPADVQAQSAALYTVQKGTPRKFTARTYGRYVPERLDDFAWENNHMAFRMYGPALIGQVSNGVDVWLKRTDSLIVNKFYYDDLNNNRSYHIDHGEGLDCYDVGLTLGAGGIAPYRERLWVGNTYSSYKVLDNGPLRTSFSLTYDSVQIAGEYLRQTLTISLDANSRFNKATVVYQGLSDTLMLAVGIALHGEQWKPNTEEVGYIVHSEDHGESGRIYVSTILPEGISEIKQDGIHVLALAQYHIGHPFVYYFGAGWSKWGITSNDDWTKYVTGYMLRISQPLKVEFYK